MGQVPQSERMWLHGKITTYGKRKGLSQKPKLLEQPCNYILINSKIVYIAQITKCLIREKLRFFSFHFAILI